MTVSKTFPVSEAPSVEEDWAGLLEEEHALFVDVDRTSAGEKGREPWRQKWFRLETRCCTRLHLLLAAATALVERLLL